MASNELKEIRKAMTKEAIREHQMAKTGGTQTDLFTCGKCKKKNCTYTQVSLPAPVASMALTSVQEMICCGWSAALTAPQHGKDFATGGEKLLVCSGHSEMQH